MGKYTSTLMEIITSELQNSGHNEFVNNGLLTFNNDEYAFIQKVLYFDKDVQKIVTNKFFKGFSFKDEKVDKYFKESFVTRFLEREIGRQTVEAFASQVLYVTLTREDYIYTTFSSEMYKFLEQHSETVSEDRGKGHENTMEQGQTKQRQRNTSHDDYKDNVNNTHSDETNNSGNSTDDNRSANATLPQSEVNINVDNTNLNYADENNISRNKNTHTDNTSSNGKYNTDSEGTKEGTFDGLSNGESDSKKNTQQENVSNHESLNKTYLIDNLAKIKNMREEIFNIYDKKCFLHIW